MLVSGRVSALPMLIDCRLFSSAFFDAGFRLSFGYFDPRTTL